LVLPSVAWTTPMFHSLSRSLRRTVVNSTSIESEEQLGAARKVDRCCYCLTERREWPNSVLEHLKTEADLLHDERDHLAIAVSSAVQQVLHCRVLAILCINVQWLRCSLPAPTCWMLH
ncbi:unnamed protein product, partial [Polarella glacialis]